jgi:hypothetical protein
MMITCQCGLTQGAETMKFAGWMQDEDQWLELRNCSCGSTASIRVNEPPDTEWRTAFHGSCCSDAVEVRDQCVCMALYHCQDHGIVHVGTHD